MSAGATPETSRGSTRIEACRICGGRDLHQVLDLGVTPLADRLMTPAQLEEPEPAFPLDVVFCPGCSLMQITETVSPEILFADAYPYYSSFSPALLEHSRLNAENIMRRKALGADSLVVELASNDGYLLKNFVAAGIPVLGIDPADGPAAAAEKVGVRTLNDFFTLGLAERLASDGTRADVIIGNNVLAHVADTNGFVQGIRTLLKDDGLVVIECPYVRDLVDHREFDTIYHEHLCYFSVHALAELFRRNGLFLNDVERLPIHGGSLRLYVETCESPREGYTRLVDEEKSLGIDTERYYADFADRVRDVSDTLLAMLRKLKSEGASIAAYGAAAKGATLLNSIGIGADLLDFCVDRNVHKQGKHMPGARIPILAPEALLERQPEYTLMLPWNFRDEILKQQAEYRARGGKFIVPIPSPEIV